MRIKLKYPDVDTFLQKYGPNISRGGIFISTKTPRPVGTAIRFDFILVHEGKEQSVLRGEGSVHFVKEHDPNAPGRPNGMGVKFLRLFDDGEALVAKALALREPAPEAPPPAGLPRGTREISGEVELANPQDISSGEFPTLQPASRGGVLDTRAPEPDPELDVDALAEKFHVSAERVDAVLRRPRERADEGELEALLARPTAPAVSSETAAAELEQLLARRRK
jgi:uncharacterized protein (TIGR02266 family)